MSAENTNDTPAKGPYTVESAVGPLMGLLSDMPEDTQGREAPVPKPKTPAEEAEGTEGEEHRSDEDSDEHLEQHDGEEQRQTETPKIRITKLRNDRGEEVDEEFTEEELRGNVLRHRDYTQKTQALAEAKRKFETEDVPAVRAERQKISEQLGKMEDAIRALVPDKPDWDKLRQELDPEQFGVAWTRWNNAQRALESVQAERKRVAEQQQADAEAAHATHVEEQRRKLVEKVPEWVDESKAKAEKKEMAEYAISLGFTPEELLRVTDHRVLLILRAANQFAKLNGRVSRAKEKVANARVAEPGSGVPQRTVTTETKARQRLAKTGRVEDAAAVFLEQLG